MSNKYVFCELNVTHLQFSITTCRQRPKVNEFELIEVQWKNSDEKTKFQDKKKVNKQH